MAQTESDIELLQNVEIYEQPTNRSRGGAMTGNTSKGDDNLDDEPDETISERLWGLTEMFPQPVREFTGYTINATTRGIKSLYKFSCNVSWIFFTSSLILFAPVIFETERAQMQEMQKTQQKQVLLGPGSAMAAVSSGSQPELPTLR